jgi:DNA-binding transcriptional LysR family regulator
MLQEAHMDPLREGLLADELDLVLMPALEPIPGLEQHTVYREPMAVLRPGSAGGGPVTLDAVADDQFILVPDVCGLTSFTRRLFADNGSTLNRYPGEATSYAVLEEWTRLGLGSALVPISKLPDATAPLARELHHRDEPVLISYEAAWRTGSRAHAELARLVAALAAA